MSGRRGREGARFVPLRRLAPLPAGRAPGRQGRTLVELLTLLAALALAAALGVPAVADALQRMRLRAAARELGMVFRQARTDAVLGRASVGVVFDASAGHAWSVYRDGNGNGIRSADIAAGVDRRVRGPVAIGERHPGVEARLLVPPAPCIPPERGTIEGDDPVQFGRTDIVSFSPAGSSTGGTVYLATGRSRLAAVRLLSATARVRLWEYDAAGRRWTPR